MDTGNISKDEFIRIILDRDLRNIFKAQYLVASKRKCLQGKDLKIKTRRKKINRDTEAIETALKNPNFVIQSQGEKFITESSVPVDIRFFDMRRKQNLQIYNKIIWGILYNNAYPDIRFGYRQEIKDRVGDALNQAFEQIK